MSALDPRLHAFRDDLADASLSDCVTAGRYVTHTDARIIQRQTIVRAKPDWNLPRETEYLLGEPIRVFERKAGWAWVQSGLDAYVGYVAETSISVSAPVPTHRVIALSAPVHPEPTLKTLPKPPLGFGDRVRICETQGAWSRIDDKRSWLYTAHLKPLDTIAPPQLAMKADPVMADPVMADPVATAVRFLEVPYLWGGRNGQGVDCSSLIQFALNDWELPCPRDSDQQERMLGVPIPHHGDERDLKRNDIVFWPGHVGIMMDATQIVHANATDMAVKVWNLDRLEAYIEDIEGNPIRSIRRLALKMESASL